MLNIGIIGCGKMGKVHAEVFSANQNCQVIGLYNRTKEKALDLQKRLPAARVYDSWQDLVADGNIQAVAISTPQYQRFEQYSAATAQGKHVFLEKPLSLSLDDMQATLDLMQNSPCCMYVDSQLRSHPVILAINQHIQRIGRIFHIDMEFSMFREEIKWKNQLLAGGGILRELCGHQIDLASSWLGDARCVCASNKIIVTGRETEDFTINLIEYKNGASLLVSSNYFEHRGKLYTGRMLGELGQINYQFSSYEPLDAIATLYIKDEQFNIPVYIPDAADINSIYPGHMDSFKKEIQRFVELVMAGKTAADTLDTEWRTAQIIAGSYESTRLDRKVFFPLEKFSFEQLKDCYQHFTPNSAE